MLSKLLPKFAVELDGVFSKYDQVYILGDVHDNENLFKRFLLETQVAFIHDKYEHVEIDALSNYFLKPGVLLVFLGDVLYKTNGHFKSIVRFILNNKENCLLILGNNEVKFVYEYVHLFIDVCKSFLPYRKYESLRNAKRARHQFQVVNCIYSLIEWFRCCPTENRLKRAWMWYYTCLFNEFLSDQRNLEDLMIVMYILTESVVIGYSSMLKLILLHAGFNPYRRLRNQRTFDICNMRMVKGTHRPWFEFYNRFDFTVLYGHWSALTKGEQESKPFFHANTICIDTGCCYTNVLTYVSFGPLLMSNGILRFERNVKKSKQHIFHELCLYHVHE